MKRFLQISALSLLMLAFLSFSGSADLMAQGKSHKHKGKEYKHKKGGPPDWAPAHGYHRKGGEDERKDHKWKDKDKEWKHKEEELARREEDLKKREEALKRRQKSRFPKRDKVEKRRPGDIINKRPGSGDNDRLGDIVKRKKTEQEEKLERRQEEIRRRQEEIKNPAPVKKDKDWTGGSGW